MGRGTRVAVLRDDGQEEEINVDGIPRPWSGTVYQAVSHLQCNAIAQRRMSKPGLMYLPSAYTEYPNAVCQQTEPLSLRRR
jgi:hypothetical protein